MADVPSGLLGVVIVVACVTTFGIVGRNNDCGLTVPVNIINFVFQS